MRDDVTTSTLTSLDTLFKSRFYPEVDALAVKFPFHHFTSLNCVTSLFPSSSLAYLSFLPIVRNMKHQHNQIIVNKTPFVRHFTMTICLLPYEEVFCLLLLKTAWHEFRLMHDLHLKRHQQRCGWTSVIELQFV